MECLSVKGDQLFIGGADVEALAKKYGTPLYIMDENTIRKNIKEYKDSLNKYYKGESLVLYAGKAFCCKQMYKILTDEGIGADLMAGGETYTAQASGFDMSKVYIHGNNKTEQEISMLLDIGVGAIVADNIYELKNIQQIAEQKGIIAQVLLRVKPGVEAHTHEFIQTGQIDSKFGVAIENGEAILAAEYASKCPNINLKGLHCHIGSQIFDYPPFELAARKCLEFASLIKSKFGITIKELNLGGGIGIKYTQADDPIDISKFIQGICAAVESNCARLDLPLPKILMEPGRSIVATSGITVYTIGCVKQIEGVRKYVSVDGGMSDNPRYIMYQSMYEAVRVRKPIDDDTETVRVVGKFCESGDILLPDIKMPELQVGDLIAIEATGAYNYSMSSNYNRVPRPPVVMVRDGKDYIAINRESYEDLVKNDA